MECRVFAMARRPEIVGAANSNVKLDFRVDFSGTHRKALQASPRLQSGRD